MRNHLLPCVQVCTISASIFSMNFLKLNHSLPCLKLLNHFISFGASVNGLSVVCEIDDLFWSRSPATGSEPGPQEGPSQASAPSGPQGFRKHFFRSRLDCDNQPPDPDRLFQRCFMATVTTINVEGPS